MADRAFRGTPDSPASGGYRMLGSLSEADDAVQDAWLRLSRADTGSVENVAGWLTTVVARVCLNMLRTRAARSRRGAPSRPSGRPHPRTHRDPRCPRRGQGRAPRVGTGPVHPTGAGKRS